MKTLRSVLNFLRGMTKHIFTKGNVTTTLVDLTEGIGNRTPAEILILTDDGAVREYSEKLPDGRVITYSLEIEEEVLEEEEEIEISSRRRVDTSTAETPGGNVDTCTRVIEGEQIVVNKTFSRTVSTDEGTSKEVLQSSETEGGGSVTVEFRKNSVSSEPIIEHEPSPESDKTKTFVSDTGEMVTEL